MEVEISKKRNYRLGYIKSKLTNKMCFFVIWVNQSFKLLHFVVDPLNSTVRSTGPTNKAASHFPMDVDYIQTSALLCLDSLIALLLFRGCLSPLWKSCLFGGSGLVSPTSSCSLILPQFTAQVQSGW